MSVASTEATLRSPKDPLTAMSYFSEAGSDLETSVLVAEMVGSIRARNTDRGVTGAIAYQDGYIRQWIEGPQPAVARLWDRIRLDPRHRIQWVEPATPVTGRHFPSSPMKLALALADIAQGAPKALDDVVALPVKHDHLLLDGQCDRLSCSCGGPCICGETGATTAQMWHLDTVYRVQIGAALAARAAALVAQLTGPDSAAFSPHMLATASLSELAMLVEAVLDQMQAGWMTDSTTMVQRHQALAVFQSVLRRRVDVAEPSLTVGCALVSLLPDTDDLAGIMIKVALLRRAGWSVKFLMPDTRDDILTHARALRPDLIVLAGSGVVPKSSDMRVLEHVLLALPAFGNTPVIVGGKLARTQPSALMGLGARAVCGSIADITAIASPYVFASPSALKKLTRRDCTQAQINLVEGALSALGYRRGGQPTGQAQTGNVIPFRS